MDYCRGLIVLLLVLPAGALAVPVDVFQRPTGGGQASYATLECDEIQDATTAGCALVEAADAAAQATLLETALENVLDLPDLQGTLTHEQGGLEADVSAYSGIPAISAGSTYDLDTLTELNTAVSATLIDTGTLTDTKYCVYDSAGSEIDCNAEGYPTGSVLYCGYATFDPTSAYDQDTSTRNLPLMDVDSTKYSSGVTFQKWAVTYTTGDPTTELNANLYYADNWSWSNETSMDVLDTTSGSSSESTPANINGGSAVAAGKVLYIGFDADPTDDNVLVHFKFCYQ